MDARIKAILVLICLSAFSGCAGLPQIDPTEAVTNEGLILIHQDKSVRLYARPGFNPTRFGELVLDHVEVQALASLGAQQKAEQQQLGADLAAAFTRMPKRGDGALRLHLDIRLYDIKPVSPALNALTLVVAFVPLDTGSVIVDTTYRDETGSIQAHRIEQLTGSVFNIKASFSAYGQHKIMLNEWARRCTAVPVCLEEGMEPKPQSIALH